MFDLKNIEAFIVLGKKTALFSFLIGTLILGIYYITQYNGIIYISILFITLAFLVNTFLAIYLLYQFFKNKKNRKAIGFTLLVMTLNIPIGLYYIDLGFTLYNKFLNQ